MLILAVPSAPGAPEPYDWTANQVDLKWKEPVTDGGTPITGYIIEKKDKYSTMWEKALETSTPSVTALVQGLIEGNEYQFRVIALNKAGQSEPGDISKTFIAKPRYCEFRRMTIMARSFNKFHLFVNNKIGVDNSSIYR